MAIERLVGLFVTDDDMYRKYREYMYPVLQTYGGAFGYDFKVSEVLKSEVEAPINRVFTIFFETEESMNAFFTNKEYLEIRKKYYEPSVSATTVISKHER